MKIQADKNLCDRARAAHDLYILNMFIFNLPVVAGTLAYTIGGERLLIDGVIIALLVSLGILVYTRRKARRLPADRDWFVKAHWQLAAKRGNLLLVGYLVSAVIIGIGVLVGSGMADKNMQVIMLTVFTRVGIVPGLVMVLVTAVLEGQSMHLANNGIVPASLVRQFPPPDDVVVVDATNEDGG